MPSYLRIFGYTLVLGTTLMVFVDAQRQAIAKEKIEAKAQISPAGFTHNLSNTGKITTAFSGRVTMIAEDVLASQSGVTKKSPRYKVEGNDPLPAKSVWPEVTSGMQLTEATIASLAKNSSNFAFRVDASRCLLPINDKGNNLEFRFSELWKLYTPTFLIQDLNKKSIIDIKAPSANLNPETQDLFINGDYILNTENLELTGEDLHLDPKTSVVQLQTPKSNASLEWEIRQNKTTIARGHSKDGGELRLNDNQGYTLSLANATTLFKENFNGTLVTEAIELQLAKSANNQWLPTIAKFFSSHKNILPLWEDDRFSLKGTEGEIIWQDNGTPKELLITGPIHIASKNDTFISATAKGDASLNLNTGEILLKRGVSVQHKRGTIESEEVVFKDKNILFKNDVSFKGEVGSGSGGALTIKEEATWQIQGNATFISAKAPVQLMHANNIVLSSNFIEAAGDVLAKETGDQLTTIKADYISATMWEDEIEQNKSTYYAKDNIKIETKQFAVEGDELKQVDKNRFFIKSLNSFSPVKGSFFGSPPVKFESEGVAFSRSFIELEGAPSLHLTLNDMELENPNISIAAEDISFNRIEQRLIAKNNVVLKGGIVGKADKMDLNESEVLLYPKRNQSCSLTIALKNKRSAQIESKKIKIKGRQELLANDNVTLKYIAPGLSHHIRCKDLIWGAASGKATGWVEAQFNDINAEAKTLSWENDSYTFLNSALLEHPSVKALAHKIIYNTTSGDIFAIGEGSTPATLFYEKDKTAQGEWLHYNYINQIIKARQAE